MPACGTCGQSNPAGARFCNACGAALGADVREERKVVTVLFADVVGFTARAERMDPEDVRRLIAPLHARLRAELDRRGGTVEKFIGDAVMAVFGAPVAHEDDAERAVRAALAIRDALVADGELELRIGITTGEALIALGARPETGEGIASGDVVNTAARLQAAAPAGGILVDAATYRATERAVEYRDAAAVVAKGKAEPVAVRLAARARGPVGLERPAAGPLVGRAEELTLLRDTLARVQREREPQLVTLVGVPGIGKSRLVHELLDGLERQRPTRAPAVRPLAAVRRRGDVLGARRDGQGARGDPRVRHGRADAGQAERRRRLRRRRARGRSPDRGVPASARGPRRRVAAAADDRSSEAFAAWRRFLEALAEERPVVLVFEDLHWADDALLDFVDELLDWASGVPLLVLATARPELLDRRKGWGGGPLNSATIRLSPLSDAETRSLVDGLLGPAPLSSEAQRRLLGRAGGNPLYAREFVRMLTDRGDELAMPESVQGIIAARVDALPREEKALLQQAAVMGQVFWLGALGTERWRLEEALHMLERKEFVRRRRRSSVAGEAEYAFSHVLVRDVAYEQIPRSQRADRHRAAGEWIESLGRLEDHAEMLAHHYGEALTYAERAGAPPGDLAPRAARALREAGNRAFLLGAHAAAIRYYERALATGSAAGWTVGERCEVLLALGEAQARAGDMSAAKETYVAAADLARDRDPAALARAALGYGGRFVWARAWGDTRLVPLLEEALAALPDADSDLRARLLARLGGGPLRDTAPPAQRMAMCRDAVEIARRLGDRRTLAYALDGLHCANWGPDVVAGRLAIADELISVAEAEGDAERAYAGHDYRFFALIETGDVAGARAELAVKTQWANELGQPAHLWDVVTSRAMLELFHGRFDAAEATSREALELGRFAQSANAKVAFDLQQYGLRRGQGRLTEFAATAERAVDDYPAYAVWRYVLVDVLVRIGRTDEARVALDALAATGFEVRVEMHWLASLCLLAEPCRELRDARRAATLYRALLRFARHNATTPPELCLGSVSRSLGILAATMSDWDAAARHFEDAMAMNAAMDARPWLASTQHDYARMLLARDGTGDRERARQLGAAAEALAAELGMRGLSSSPHLDPLLRG